MKYNIFKYNIFKRYNFSTFIKRISIKKYNPITLIKKLNFKKYKPLFYLSNFAIKKVLKNLQYLILKQLKRIKIKSFKSVPLYGVGFVLFLTFVYIIIPKFYDYKSMNIEENICAEYNLKCPKAEDIKYKILPYPKLVIKNLKFYNKFDTQVFLGNVKELELGISLKNIFNREKIVKIEKFKLNEVNLNFDFLKIPEYKKIFFSLKNPKPIIIKKGKISFYKDKKYISSIENPVLKFLFEEKKDEIILKGNFLGEKIFINFEKSDNLKNLVIKIPAINFISKIEMTKNENKALVRLDKNRFTGIFEYKDDKITIKKGSLRNIFLDGKVDGVVNFSPYFDFILNVDLNSFNFNRLYSHLFELNSINEKELFNLGNKLNGQINLSINKILSKYDLIKSLESRLVFKNGSISVNQLLLNLGKLGAADINGRLNNDMDNRNFSFEQNIFIDNEKYFFRKFGIYNKESISNSLFVSGKFSLKNLKMHLNEISNTKKINENDISFIEKQFNIILLSDGYKSFFNFPNFKGFVRLVLGETE